MARSCIGNLSRRHFLHAAAPVRRTHIVTLSFDDGLKKSFHRIAEIHERFRLRACLNVIATAHLPGFHATLRGAPDPGIMPFVRGDFSDWNALKRRGHEVMAHSYDHASLTGMPVEAAKASIDRCAAYFEKHLKGFRASRSVYNFAYNASNPEIEQHALSKFMAIRTHGSLVNPIPSKQAGVRIGCRGFGPANCDDFVETEINRFLASPGGWFVFNGHGLDEEGWGPMSTRFLESLLGRLVKLPHVAVRPAGEVVRRGRP